MVRLFSLWSGTGSVIISLVLDQVGKVVAGPVIEWIDRRMCLSRFQI